MSTKEPYTFSKGQIEPDISGKLLHISAEETYAPAENPIHP